MGPLQLVSHVVQKHLAGEHETHWDRTNKAYIIKKGNFVCLVPVRFLLTSKVFLYHVTDQLQRAHSCVGAWPGFFKGGVTLCQTILSWHFRHGVL